MENRILAERFLGKVQEGAHYVDALKTFGTNELNEKQFDLLMKMAEESLPFSERIRVLYDMSRSMKFMNKTFHGISYDQIEQKCFFVLQQEILRQAV